MVVKQLDDGVAFGACHDFEPVSVFVCGVVGREDLHFHLVAHLHCMSAVATDGQRAQSGFDSTRQSLESLIDFSLRVASLDGVSFFGAFNDQVDSTVELVEMLLVDVHINRLVFIILHRFYTSFIIVGGVKFQVFYNECCHRM